MLFRSAPVVVFRSMPLQRTSGHSILSSTGLKKRNAVAISKQDAILVDVSDIFYFLSARGGGRGESEAPGEGCRFFLENPRRGGGSRRGGGFPGGLFGPNWGIWGGGGLIFFFSGPKRPPSHPSDIHMTRVG